MKLKAVINEKLAIPHRIPAKSANTAPNAQIDKLISGANAQAATPFIREIRARDRPGI